MAYTEFRETSTQVSAKLYEKLVILKFSMVIQDYTIRSPKCTYDPKYLNHNHKYNLCTNYFTTVHRRWGVKFV